MTQSHTKTACITGASSGLGSLYAEYLAAEGYNLIITARRCKLLDALAQRLIEAHHISVRIVVADLAADDGIARVVAAIHECDDLAFLVNNAGFGVPGLFAELDIEQTIDMVTVHVVATKRLTYAALQKMIPRREGIIINVSSVAAFLNTGSNVTYCSTKAYLNTFSLALAAEVKEHNIHVQALCPGFTYTGFHDTEYFEDFDRKMFPKFFWLRAEWVVRESLAAAKKKSGVYIPSLRYRVIVLLLRNRMISKILHAMMGNTATSRMKKDRT